MKSNLFFFYGSLRSGYWNNRILSKDSKLISKAATIPSFDLFIGRFGPVPCCVPNEKGRALYGELWELSDNDASRVRDLERGYEEGKFAVISDAGLKADAFIYYVKKVEDCHYVMPDPVLIESGDYADAISPDRVRKPAPLKSVYGPKKS